MSDEKDTTPANQVTPGGRMVAAVDEIAEDASAEVIAERKGMFGVRGTGDTSGYGGLRRTVALPGASTPPYGGWMDDVANALTEAATRGRAAVGVREGRRPPRRDHLLHPPRGPARRRLGAA